MALFPAHDSDPVTTKGISKAVSGDTVGSGLGGLVTVGEKLGGNIHP